MTIVEHCNESQTKWDHGEFEVRIESPTSSQPIGYCNKGEKAEQQIHKRAMHEGAEVEIDKKVLKTGREIWTVRRLSVR